MSIYYLECLAQATYLVQHDGKAFIVDPRRDVEAYMKVRASWLGTCTVSLVGVHILNVKTDQISSC